MTEKDTEKIENTEEIENDSEVESIDSYDSQDPNNQYYNPEHGFRKEPIEEVRTNVKDMEQCYLDTQKEFEEVEELVAKYKSLKAKCNKMADYWAYRGPWTVYMDRMQEEFPDEKYKIHEDRNLFDLSDKFDQLTRELLRESALEVAKDV
ncbi:hypothetical protein CJU89_5172 [Yarrowia sp. B02]|nr:hypothetical protein CJU89_5172 [Yarrowia sp. B02]